MEEKLQELGFKNDNGVWTAINKNGGVLTLHRKSSSTWSVELQDSHWDYLKPTPDNIELLLEALNIKL